MPKLGIKEHEIVKISKKGGLLVFPDSELKSQVDEKEALSLVEGLEKFLISNYLGGSAFLSLFFSQLVQKMPKYSAQINVVICTIHLLFLEYFKV